MVSPLYWVSDLVYTLVLGIILGNEISLNAKPGKQERAFRRLVAWLILFCIQDILWGLCGSIYIKGDRLFFLSSTIFHISTVITTYFWLDYVLTYLSDRIKYHNIYLAIDCIIIAIQIILVIINCFKPVIFYIENGIYYTAGLRPLAFLNQYIVYVIISGITAFCTVSVKGEIRKKYATVFMFALAPLLSGLFQLLYPNAPFHSIGYFLGCFIIYMFIVSYERDALKRLQYEKNLIEKEKIMEEQIIISNTDQLTGLYNRRAYEEALSIYNDRPIEDDFIYISVDLNGLKVVNDTFGHAAGDEQIIGTALCMKKAIGDYGKLYRIGGDEFVALLNASQSQLERIKNDLNNYICDWKGMLCDKLSISVGSVLKSEFPDYSVTELAKVADTRMYFEKEMYYKNRGIDRRIQKSVYSIINDSYLKILKINLTLDCFEIIKIDEKELAASKGYSDKLSEWIYNFGCSKQVFENDYDNFSKKINIDYIKKYFSDNKNKLTMKYKRLVNDEYRMVLLEILKCDNYSENNEVCYLYVKDIEIEV